MPRAPFSVYLARALLLALCCLLGIALFLGVGFAPWKGAVIGTLFAIFLIFVDTLLGDFSLRGFSHGTIGLMIGLGCAWMVTRVGFFEIPFLVDNPDADNWRAIFQLALYISLGFIGVTLALRSDRNDFSFVIPYVKFRQEAVRDRPLLPDANAIVDGRIIKVADVGFLQGQVIVPRFVLEELHQMAASVDPAKTERARAGLDHLDQMKRHKVLDADVYEGVVSAEPSLTEESVDTRLLDLARRLDARLVTNDTNLGRVARLRGITVLNFHELAQAVRVVLHPGDLIELTLVKEGKDDHQAVGYLPDGAMVVINHARSLIGSTRTVRVSGSMQTSAGRLMFAELEPVRHEKRFE